MPARKWTAAATRSVANWLLVALAISASGCATAPYKDDIGSFRTSVGHATTAFDALDRRAAASVEASRFRSLARAKPRINVGQQCTGWEGTVEQQIVNDIGCLAAWSEHRSRATSVVDPEACKGAREDIRQGKTTFYDFASLQAAEGKACDLLVDNRTSGHAQPLVPVATLLEETPKLSAALRAYADALAEIADAEDREALNGSVAGAKVQLLALLESVDKRNGEDSSASPLAGPISDLVGSALVAVLERRRLKALQETTAAADPLIASAAVLLSNASVPLTYIEIGQSKRTFIRAVPGDQEFKTAEEWKGAYTGAAEARGKYLATYGDSPVGALQAMANAHAKLTQALADPNRQYESVKAAVSDFAAKAKVVKEAADKKKEEQAGGT